MKLISMTEFVLAKHQEYKSKILSGLPLETSYKEHSKLCLKYANLLNQPLTLGMFVLCDFEGNVLEEPERWSNYDPLTMRREPPKSDWWLKCDTYQKAKERVLFEGFEIAKKGMFYMVTHESDRESIKGNVMFKMLTGERRWTTSIIGIETLDDVANNLSEYFNHDFIFTPTAIKEIGL